MSKLVSQLRTLDLYNQHSPSSFPSKSPSQPKAQEPTENFYTKPLILLLIGFILFIIGILATVTGFLLSFGYSFWPANILWAVGILFALLGFVLVFMATFWLCNRGVSHVFPSEHGSNYSIKSANSDVSMNAKAKVEKWKVSAEFVPSRAGSLTTSIAFPVSNASNKTGNQNDSNFPNMGLSNQFKV